VARSMNLPAGTTTTGAGQQRQQRGENQKPVPRFWVNNVSSYDTVDFIPKPSPLNMSGTWTDDAKNGTGQLHNWRMFPARCKGTLVPNTWYATEDGNTEGGSKNHYQDAVYLLVNFAWSQPP